MARKRTSWWEGGGRSDEGTSAPALPTTRATYKRKATEAPSHTHTPPTHKLQTLTPGRRESERKGAGGRDAAGREAVKHGVQGGRRSFRERSTVTEKGKSAHTRCHVYTTDTHTHTPGAITREARVRVTETERWMT